MTLALVALGTNLGDRQSNLDRAMQLLAAVPGVRLVAASGSHATQSIGGPFGQGDFLNAAALFETSLKPAALFAAMHDAETALGRRRDGPRWSPRPIDVDLLLYGSLVVETTELTVPHPRMAFRRFVIEPAAEVAPTMMHPTIGWTLAELREHLRTAPPYVAITGAPGAGKSQLAADVSGLLGARLLEDPSALHHTQADPTGASGPSWESEIELFGARSAQLAEAMPAGKEHGLVVSDYWFEQAQCFAALTLPPERREEFDRRLQAAAATVPRPKLLVLLDAPIESLWQRLETAPGRPPWLNRESFERLRQATAERAMAPGRGPLLRLDGRQPENARIELAAAIEAMT